MNVKKILENKLRGWFPKDPHSLGASRVSRMNKDQTPVVTLEKGAVRATLIYAVLAVLWIVFSVFVVDTVSFMETPVTLRVSCVTVGLALGVLFGVLFTKMQFKQIKKCGRFTMSLRTSGSIFLGIGLAFIVFSVLISRSLLALNAQYLLVFVCIASFFATVAVRLQVYEKQQKVFIISYFFKEEYFVIPQANATNLQTLPRLNTGSKSGARTITLLALLLPLSLLGTCYYTQLIGLEIFLLGIVAVLAGSLGLSIALNYHFKEDSEPQVEP